MKNLFNLFCFLMLVGSFTLLGIYQSNGTSEKAKVNIQPIDTAKAIETVQEVNDIVKAELYLDSTSFGVCDTCKSSFVSVIQENRNLVNSVLEENLVLYDNWMKTKDLNDSLTNVNKMVMLEIKRGRSLLHKK